MEPYGEVGVLMNLGGESPGGEILKSLLTSPKMQKSEPVEVNILQDLETRTQEEQIVFQIELGEPVKSEFIPNGENLIHHIPVTYLTADSPNLTPGSNGTLVEPVTYVLSRDVLPDTGRYCTVGSDDPQKVFLVQEVNEEETAYGDPERKVYAVKESQTSECRYPGVWSLDGRVDSCDPGELKHENEPKDTKKRRKTENSPGGGRGKRGKREEEESLVQWSNNTKTERKISTSKKPLNKRKNSKLKSKLKASGKGFPVKNQVKSMKPPAEGEKMATTAAAGEEEEEEVERRNLFELTKLEDNVDQVARRLKIGCECSESNCFDGLNPNDVFKHRLNIADLTKAEHDMYLMGVIMASIHNLEETCRHKERIRIRSCYAYQGKKVCLTAFLYLQHVTLYQMKRLRSHLKNHGVSPRIHGNRGRKPANTFSLDIYRRAVNFVQAYIEEHCVKTVPNLATRPPNGKPQTDSTAHDQKPIIKKESKGRKTNRMTSYHLPPECTKRIVHGEYKAYCENFKPSQKVMKYSTFTNFLKKQFPNVKFQKREEKKETERWKPKDGRPGTEEGERKPKEEPGVDKCVQVDKSLSYVPTKSEILANGHRTADGSGNPQPGYGVAGQVADGQSYDAARTENSSAEQFYAVAGAV